MCADWPNWFNLYSATRPVRCATEHPHHTLPILFSLKNSEKGEGRASAEPRVAAAAALLARLALQLPRLLQQMELVCDGNFDFKLLIKNNSIWKGKFIYKLDVQNSWKVRKLNTNISLGKVPTLARLSYFSLTWRIYRICIFILL